MLKVVSVPPKISDEMRKGRIESFYNTCARVYQVKDFVGCTYDSKEHNIVFHIQHSSK